MKILFIAPLPPPITGHSLVSQVLLEELQKDHDVQVVNLSKNSLKEGINGFERIVEVILILKEIFQKRKSADLIYFTISESLAGNIKDLFIYSICTSYLSTMYIHLHGGSLKRLLWDRYPLLLRLNKMFIRKLGGAIISGKSHQGIFENILPFQKIHTVPNFAKDYLFVNEEIIEDKFSSLQPVRILYMSNLIKKKGYNELADSFFAMEADLKTKVQIDFAGSFDSDVDKKIFYQKIRGINQISYHGVVNDEEKKILFSKAHIFCLPTSYFEGQPVSILEAYASGCVVVTTEKSGITDVFTNKINGFSINENSPESIMLVLKKIIQNPKNLLQIAKYNRELASTNFRMSAYNSKLKTILESSISDQHKKINIQLN